MAAEYKIRAVLNCLHEIPGCPSCDTRLRFGDFECPHCGADLEDHLSNWARELVDRLTSLG